MTETITTEITPASSVTLALKVDGAPLTTTGTHALMIAPDELHLLAWLFEDESGVLTWRINLATAHGRITEQGDLFETRSRLTFVRPLNEYADDAPQWLKTLCADWLIQLNGLLNRKES
jgi:hypothetical protein